MASSPGIIGAGPKPSSSSGPLAPPRNSIATRFCERNETCRSRSRRYSRASESNSAPTWALEESGAVRACSMTGDKHAPGRSPVRPSAPALEELHCALVLFGGPARLEGSEVPAPAGVRIQLARIEPVFAGRELPDHGCTPPIGSGDSPLDPCNYRTAPQQITHVDDDQGIQDQRGQLDRRKAAAQLVDLEGDIDAAADRGDPFAPAALEPQAVGLGESQRSISHGERGEPPELAIGGVGGEVEKDARKFLRRGEVQPIDHGF